MKIYRGTASAAVGSSCGSCGACGSNACGSCNSCNSCNSCLSGSTCPGSTCRNCCFPFCCTCCCNNGEEEETEAAETNNENNEGRRRRRRHCVQKFDYCGIGSAEEMVLDEICAKSDCGRRFCNESLCSQNICELCSAENDVDPPWREGRRHLGPVMAMSFDMIPPQSGESQIGLVIEGCTDCVIHGATDQPRPDPENPARTLPIGLSVGKYLLDYGPEFPFEVKTSGGRFYIDGIPMRGIEIIPPDGKNPLIHRIRISEIPV